VSRSLRRLCVVLVVVTAACGSTLQPTATQTTTGADGLAVDTAAPGGGDPTAGGVDVAPDGAPGSGGGSPVPGQTAGPGTATTAPQGSGITAPVKIGVVTTDPGALLAAFGSNAQGDPLDVDRAVVEQINRAGGAAGRKFDPRFTSVDIGANQNAEGQRVCEEMTSGDKVDLVLAKAFSNEVMLSCLGQRGVPVLDLNTWVPDATYVAQHANWFVPYALGVDRYSAAGIDVAVAQGVLKRGDKLGVLFEDCPWGRRTYERVIQPLAQAHGVATERATIKCIENLVGDLGPVTNQATAAALRFRSSNVTHVMVLTAGEGFVVARFSDTAVQQGYFPKYLVTSNGYPYNNSASEGTLHWKAEVPPNTTGIGWQPYIDIGPRPTWTSAQTARQEECRKATASIPPPGGTPDTADARAGFDLGRQGLCENYFIARDIIVASGGRTSVAEFAAGYRRFLPTATASILVAGRYSATRIDGVGFVRALKFDPASKRFVYTGEPYPVP
jgi:hypothetical protein